MPGPPRIPAKRLEARGSWLAKVRAKTEPKTEATAPRCPSWLPAAAKTVFRAFCHECGLMGTLARSDGATIARYADLTVRYIAAALVLHEHGESIECHDKNGNVTNVQPRPEVAIAANIGKMLLAIECQFGLTPASRSRVQAGVKEEASDTKAKFFKVTG